MTRDPAPRSAAFPWFLEIPTRWMDNDVYGHVNNVVYYSYFDTVVNEHLVRVAGLRPQSAPVFGVVVETRCQYRRELTFPDLVEAGLRVAHLGRSSVRYEIGLFRKGEADAAAFGHFVHVYIDRGSRNPVPIPEPMRAALAALAA